ncbi:MAG: mitochondrial fission ELM1 family protein [Pseudomonadota bacterium]
MADTLQVNRARQLVVWLLTDGKPGHRSQLEGLVRALGRHVEVAAHWLDAMPPAGTAFREWLLRRFTAGLALPDPDLIVGCGHATHLPLLAAKRARGGLSVVLMQPSLPLFLFDLCVIPQHDRPRKRANVVATRGVLNTLRASVHQKATQGLFLIGGPSKHHKWDEKTLITQLRQIVKETPDMHWALTTSRRTPESSLGLLKSLRGIGVEVIPFEKTDPGWVADAITVSSTVWVTEDSVSMIYESLTSGARTGLLWVPRHDLDRVTAGVEQLVKDGLVTPFLVWKDSRTLVKQDKPINEAERVAEEILQRLAGWQT